MNLLRLAKFRCPLRPVLIESFRVCANHSISSKAGEVSGAVIEMNELARKHVPLYPNEDEIEQRSWNKPQWERHERNVGNYGMCDSDAVRDYYQFHTFVFAMISMFVGMIFLYRYSPDPKCRCWLKREAFLEIARREAAGLPLVDPNYIPEDKIILPDESELEGVDIVI